MKTKLTILALALACAFTIPLTPGCGSTPARQAYDIAAAPAMTIDHTMTAWGDYVKQFHPGPAAEQKVLDAYHKAKSAELLAIDAAHAYADVMSSTNSAGAAVRKELASQVAANALTDLVNIVQSFGVKL